MTRREDELPLVSVVVPVRNREQYVGPTIDSILAQDYPRIECIVVDAASTDGTLDVVGSYGERLRWLSRPDRGAFDAINDGWHMASGDVLAWLNADDLWLPGAVTTAITFLMEHPDVDVIYGACIGIDAAGAPIWYGEARKWDFERSFLHCDQIIHQAASFVRRSAIEKVGGLHPAWFHDHDLWLRLSLQGSKFAAIRDDLAAARLWRGNVHESPDYIEAKVNVIRRAAADARLPQALKRQRSRAVSNAYLRSIEYLRMSNPASWPGALRVVWRAAFTDPSNMPMCLLTPVALGWRSAISLLRRRFSRLPALG